MDYKQQVTSVTTPFQTIDIYDTIIGPTKEFMAFQQSLNDDDSSSYHAEHKDFFRPDRMIFLDGTLQSRLQADSEYHESLTHPALFSHENPKRVAIIGGGEGATLREVLKHKTVEQVVMIEIDQMMVEVSSQYLPQWSDCSNLEGINSTCWEDPRVQVFFEDAFQWFFDRFSGDPEIEEDPFDVIIMDAL